MLISVFKTTVCGTTEEGRATGPLFFELTTDLPVSILPAIFARVLLMQILNSTYASSGSL